MQAVILAAGKSSRFLPFTNLAHKALVKIMGKTLLEHTLLAIKHAGIDEVIVVINPHSPLENIVGDGKRLGLKIEFVVQSEPLGMGDALLQATDFIKGDFFLLNAYHVEFGDFVSDMKRTKKHGNHVVLLGGREELFDRYGYILLENNKVSGVVEKPRSSQSNALRLIGIYLLNKEFLSVLKDTPLEHYHFEKALDAYAKMGKAEVLQTEKPTVTLKYAWDLLEIKNYLLRKLRHHVSPHTDVSKYATIIGDVYIDEGAKIMEGACIKGPCYIGKNVLVGNNALLRNGVNLEENVIAGSYMEIRNALLMEGTETHSGFIGDSVIGSNGKIGAGFCSANVRLDRKNIAANVKESKVESYRKHLGTIIGDNVIIGAGVITMPGVIIGNDTFIGPSTTVMENVEENVKYYTEFRNIVKKQNRKES